MKKRTFYQVDFAIPVDHRVKLEKAKKTGPCQRAEKLPKYEDDCDTNHNWSSWNRSRIKIIQTSALLKLARVLRIQDI